MAKTKAEKNVYRKEKVAKAEKVKKEKVTKEATMTPTTNAETTTTTASETIPPGALIRLGKQSQASSLDQYTFKAWSIYQQWNILFVAPDVTEDVGLGATIVYEVSVPLEINKEDNSAWISSASFLSIVEGVSKKSFDLEALRYFNEQLLALTVGTKEALYTVNLHTRGDVKAISGEVFTPIADLIPELLRTAFALDAKLALQIVAPIFLDLANEMKEGKDAEQDV